MNRLNWDQFLYFLKNWFLSSTFRLSRYYYGLFDIFAKSCGEEILDYATQFTASLQIEGDYLEFGVFEGNNFIRAFRLANRHGLKNMKFYAFDSFEGLPEVTGIDVNNHPRFLKGQFACGGIERFKKLISSKKVDLNRVKIIGGWYNETLNNQTKKNLSLKKAAIVYIDCDLYESTVPVLNFITDYIQDGTVIIFDDWFLFKGNPDRGEQRAFREWLDKNKHIRVSEYRKFGWCGDSFIVHL